MKQWKVSDVKDMGLVLKEVCEVFLAEGKEIVLTAKPYKETLSAAQRRTYWMWLTEIERGTGNDKDELHREFKYRFLAPLYIRDDSGFADVAAALLRVREESPEHYSTLKEHVISELSITKATIEQMREYLDRIKRFALVDLRISLTLPEMEGIL